MVALYGLKCFLEILDISSAVFLLLSSALYAADQELLPDVISPLFIIKLSGIIFILLSLLVISRHIFLFLKNSTDQALIKLAEHKNPHLKDHLSTAYSLIVKPVGGYSREESIAITMRMFADAHISKTAEEVEAVSYKDVIPFLPLKGLLFSPRRAPLFALIIWMVLSPLGFKRTAQVVFTSGVPDFYKDAVIIPGDKLKEAVLLESEIQLGIALPREAVLSSQKGIAGIRPKLFISKKGSRTSDLAINLSDGENQPQEIKISSGVYLMWSAKFTADDFSLKSIRYYFTVNNIRLGGEYTIKIVPPAVFSSFKVRYDYPLYTGIPGRSAENELNLVCYPATKVTIEAFGFDRDNFPDGAFLYMGGEKIPMVIKNRNGKNPSAEVSFVAGAGTPSVYRFITVKNGREFLSPEYPIEIKKDLPPVVEILSPSFDMDASYDDKLPVVWSAEDDFGVVKAESEIILGKGDGGILRRITNELPLMSSGKSSEGGRNQGARRLLSDFTIDLSQFRFESDDFLALRYSVIAWDGAGNRGVSKVNSVFINSYERKHKDIMKKLSEVSSAVTDTLSAQMSARRLLKDSTSYLKWEELRRSQKEIIESAALVRQKLDSALTDMSGDPYFDGYLMKEYRGMSSNLRDLIDKPLKKALSSSQNEDAEGLASAQDEAIFMLENLSLLSSDVAKYQRVGDIQNNMLKMEKRLDYALEALKNSAGSRRLEEEDIKSIIADLDEIARLIHEIESAVKDMPQFLPDDFINSEGLKNADFPSARNALDAVKDALIKGDIEGSRRMIEELKKQLSRLRDSVKSASDNLTVRSAPSALGAAMKSASSDINTVVKKQKDILKDVRKLEEIRLENISRYQKKTLESIAVRQKELNDAVSKIVNSAGNSDAGENTAGVLSSVPLMEKILSEFSNGKVYNSGKYLEDVINYLSSDKSRLKPISPLYEKISSVLLGEQEIFEVLRSTYVPLPYRGLVEERHAKTAFLDSQKQDDLRRELNTISAGLKGILRQTAMVSYDSISKLDEAAGEMILSSQKLKDYDTTSSIEHQRKVIELLEDASSEISGAADGASSLSFGARPVPSLMPAGSHGGRGGGLMPGGVTGVLTGEKVKLPSADDYKVPPAFREDIMKYLRENRPSGSPYYEDMILKYYKRLVE